MRFYTKAHTYYCGIDLHAHWMNVCGLGGAKMERISKSVFKNPVNAAPGGGA
jgi:hypothetical protein